MSKYTTSDSGNYRCTRVTSTAAYGDIGDLSYGMKCQEKNFSSADNFYQCYLNIDVQNETSYICNRCSNDTFCIYRNKSECDVDFKLSIESMVFEFAVKNLWLSLPVPQICAWDQLACVNFRNGNVVANDELEVYQCVWSRTRGSDQLLNKHIAYDWSFLLVIIFIIAGGVGNILVCLAVCFDKRLQNVTNYFLLSLAIADLLVSLFVMPMGAIPGFLGYWPLGVAWCNVYVTCDVLACSASIMHMCCISISRYIGIRNPLKSRHHSTKKVVIIKISMAWLLSIIVSSSITVLGLINRKNIMPNNGLCVINNTLFWIFGSLVAFYIPMMTMVVSFALTVHLLKKQAILAAKPVTGASRRRLYGFDSGQHRVRRAGASLPELSAARPTSQQRTSRVAGFSGSLQERSNQGMSVSHPQVSSTSGSAGGGRARARARTVITQRLPRGTAGAARAATPHQLNLLASTTFSLRFLPNRKKDRSLTAKAVANEQKATKVLGLVFFAFVFCWAPFFLLNILFASCPTCYVSENVVEVCLWLGYVSSTINPIIYTIFNKTFRTAFLRLICCRCPRRGDYALYRSATRPTRGAVWRSAPAPPPATSPRPSDMAVRDSAKTIMIQPQLSKLRR